MNEHMNPHNADLPPEPDASSELEDIEMAEPEGADPETPIDVAERPGSTEVDREHADELADEWGEESFPASDPPSHH